MVLSSLGVLKSALHSLSFPPMCPPQAFSGIYLISFQQKPDVSLRKFSEGITLCLDLFHSNP